MPTDLNLSKPSPGQNPAVQSIRAWLFAGPGFDYTQPPAAMNLPRPEVTPVDANFMVYEAFTGKNQQNSVGRGSIGSGDPVLQAFKSATLEDLLIAAFPAPLPD